MDNYTDALLQSLIEALAATRPGSGATVLVADDSGRLAERGRAGDPTALSHLVALDLRHGATTTHRRAADGWRTIDQPVHGRDGRLLGLLRLVTGRGAAARAHAAMEAMAAHAAQVLEQASLHHELQHSFNQLFIVYEAGRLLNLSHTAEDVMSHVVGLLVRTLHFPYCAVLLIDDSWLLPAAHAGLDPYWVRGSRLRLADTFAARVLEAGAAAQFDDVADLQGLALPRLDSGLPPASVLCAPLTTRTGPMGFLEVYHSTQEPFSDDEIFVVSVLAVEMAAALENARLYQALREREERLTDYAAKLVNSQEDERRRISRDIHDGLGQMIVSALQYLQAHEYTLAEDHTRDLFQRGMAVLQECVAETRRVMSDLRPSILDDFGLSVALKQHLEAVAEQAAWQTEFVAGGGETRLAPAVETTIFRVVQEALNNTRKHAQTDRVRVELGRRGDRVAVEVRDWGCGFDLAGVAARPERGEHLGLMGMRERVSLLGGSVDIESSRGAGTTVRIELPAATMVQRK